MYIYLDACKRGFMAGCRKVVGLDGCFFKGATNGELLQDVGRDANSQMYPIAWDVVDKENNMNKDWFCDLLFRDIQVGDGKDCVFISDQQKVCPPHMPMFQFQTFIIILTLCFPAGNFKCC
jgi:hypothetical protein